MAGLMNNVDFATLVFAVLAVILVVALYRLWVALVSAKAEAERHRGTAEALRCELSALNGSSDAQRAQLETERRRGEELARDLHAAREAGEQRVELVRGEAVTDAQRSQLAITDAAARCAGLEQQVANLQQRDVELGEVRMELQRTGSALAEARELRAKLETQLEEERRSSAERLKLQDDLHNQLEDKFKGLAAQVLERNSEKFEASTKLRLDEMGEAFRLHVKELREKVEQTHQTDTSDRVALRGELARMVVASQRIDQDAINLTRALTGDRRAQGAWGELILERILEQCGLREGIEYERQLTVSDDDGKRLRPDVVVHLPGARSVVIDAKVSLTAYNDYVSANEEAETQDALNRHLTSVRSHIKQLSDKGYWQANALQGGDYVLMFVAVESAMAQALRSDPCLFEEAFRHHVILTSPSTLLATLRTIEHTWRVERQNETARMIVSEAGKLYDKFESFVDDLQDVGARLQQAQTAYDGALGKLSTGRDNLVRKAEKLRGLGLKVKKELPKDLVDGAVMGMLADASTHEDLGTVTASDAETSETIAQAVS
jgi:DNA recombination protein RmuC